MGKNIQSNQVSAVFPTAYFPSFEYIAKAIEQKAFVIETQETFQKQSIRNRCVILGPNGLQTLSIPVNKPKGSKTITGEILIEGSNNWVKNHLESIQTAYGNYPYFDYYFPDIVQLLNTENKTLISFNQLFLSYISEHLNLNYQYSFSEAFNSNYTYSLITYPFIDKQLSLNSKETLWGISTHPKLSILHFLFSFGPICRKLLTS